MKDSKILQQILKDKNFLKDGVALENIRERYANHVWNNLSLNDMLKDKNFIKKCKNLVSIVKENYCDYIDEGLAELKPTKGVKTNYIGIEIECFTKYDRYELMEKLLHLGLSDMVQPTGDGSIEPDFGEDLELRILLPEKKLASGLQKLKKLFVKGKFGINDTCGLHIHLDMRNRNVDKCFQRLLKFQDVLFGMVDKDRWNNSYCSPNINDSHYGAINRSAYSKHKTIEVRMHHATLDMKKIEKWIQLLLRIINDPNPPAIEAKPDVLRWAKKQKGLSSYVAKNFDEKWFERKKKIASGSSDMDGYW